MSGSVLTDWTLLIIPGTPSCVFLVGHSAAEAQIHFAGCLRDPIQTTGHSIVTSGIAQLHATRLAMSTFSPACAAN
jgi:hypothetical protein